MCYKDRCVRLRLHRNSHTFTLAVDSYCCWAQRGCSPHRWLPIIWLQHIIAIWVLEHFNMITYNLCFVFCLFSLSASLRLWYKWCWVGVCVQRDFGLFWPRTHSTEFSSTVVFGAMEKKGERKHFAGVCSVYKKRMWALFILFLCTQDNSI